MKKKIQLHTRRSICPVACTLDLIGDKWTMLIIRDLFLGRSQFRDFCRSPEGIATNILSKRLTRLVDYGMVERYPSPVKAGTDAYRLSRKGQTLIPVLESISNWGLEHIEGTRTHLLESPC